MPLYDYQCRSKDCSQVFEEFHKLHEAADVVRCPVCGHDAHKLLTVGGARNVQGEETPWIKSVLEVVDKSNPAPHVQRFLQDPTRSNYRAWMKGEGLRPLERGENPRRRPTERDRERHTRETVDTLLRRHQERTRVEL